MNEINACNLILDICGILILLVMILPIPAFQNAERLSHRRSRYILYSAFVHFFALLISITKTICLQPLHAKQIAGVCYFLFVIIMLFSVMIFGWGLCINENGSFRIPRGQQIPVKEIICSIIPSTLAFCLMILFPGICGIGIAWAFSLSLNDRFATYEIENELSEVKEHLGIIRATQMSVQIRPHFVFNTLSAIKTLCLIDPDAAAESIDHLAGYLRGNIDAFEEEGLIPFDTEMNHIRQYIALEQADPSRRFHFDYELDVRDFSIPPLTVQPIVENAVKHGALIHHDGSGKVVLTTEEIGELIRITVTDNGTGMNPGLGDAKKKGRIGIENTRKRIETLCNGSLTITSDAQGTRAVILLKKGG